MFRVLTPAASGFFLLLFVYGLVYSVYDGFSAVFYIDNLHLTQHWYGKLIYQPSKVGKNPEMTLNKPSLFRESLNQFIRKI